MIHILLPEFIPLTERLSHKCPNCISPLFLLALRPIYTKDATRANGSTRGRNRLVTAQNLGGTPSK